MKKVISALTVAAMCASMAASAMSAFAVYQKGDVSTYLKVISSKGEVSADGKTVTYKSAADAKADKLVVGQYLKCDPSKVSIQQIAATYTTDTTGIKLKGTIDFEKDDYPEVDVTIFDKSATATRYVNCFGYIDDFDEYFSGGSAQWGHSDEWVGDGWVGNGKNDVLQFLWNSSFSDADNHPTDYKETAHFASAKSDDMVFTQFDATMENITDGTYTIDFLASYTHPQYGVKTGNWVNVDGKNQVDIVTDGGIKIVVGDAGATPTEAQTEATQAPTTKPTDPPTTQDPNTGNQGDFKEWTWYVEDAVYDPAKDKAATINIKIGGEDPGILGYTLAIQVDGKNPADAGFTVKKFVAKDAYENLKGIQFSLDEGTCGAASKDSSADQFKAGDTLLQITMLVPESAKPGDKFKISLSELKVANFAQETLNPAVVAGTLTIAGGTDTTEPPTDPTPTETDPPATVKPTNPVVGDYLYGDVNEDGKVELVDVVKLNRFLAGLDKTLSDKAVVQANCMREKKESDADTTTGDLNGKDSLEILKHLIGLVATLPTNA